MKTRKLRKLGLAALLAAAMCLLLTGCTDAGVKDDTEKEKLLIGSDIYSPYFYLDDNGDFAGINVEIATEACKRLDMTPVFRIVNWQNKDDYLDEKIVDCLWYSYSITGREDDYAWAGPYMYGKQVVVVNASDRIYRLSDLNGRSVAVMDGTKAERFFLNEQNDAVTVRKVYSYPTIATAFAALKKGYADACAGYEIACREYIKNASSEYRILDEIVNKSEFGVAFDKGRGKEKAEKLSAVLEEMRADGTLRNILEQYDLDVDFALNGGDAQ